MNISQSLLIDSIYKKKETETKKKIQIMFAPASRFAQQINSTTNFPSTPCRQCCWTTSQDLRKAPRLKWHMCSGCTSDADGESGDQAYP